MSDKAEEYGLARVADQTAPLDQSSLHLHLHLALEEQIARCGKMELENEQLKQRLNDIARSSSWKITAPLRNVLEHSPGVARLLHRMVSGFLRKSSQFDREAKSNSHERAPQGAAPQGAEVEILPAQDIPFVVVDLHSSQDPIEETMRSPAFASCLRFFAANPSARRALVSVESQALLYSIIRNQKPSTVVEIGTYKASTTEAICRALQCNGAGLLHTVDPYGSITVPPILARWPNDLRAHVNYSSLNSMGFFGSMIETGSRAELIFIDGNHDYEFALFDLQCAARVVDPGGFLFVDNISQGGPFLAAREFLAINPSWRELGRSLERYHSGEAYDADRRTIINTDFCVLRAPTSIHVTSRPLTFGQIAWIGDVATGIELNVEKPASGTLHLQCVLRELGDKQTERAVMQTVALDRTAGAIRVPFDEPLPKHPNTRGTAELWLTWDRQEPLTLSTRPVVF